MTYGGVSGSGVVEKLFKSSSGVDRPLTRRALDGRRLHFTQLTLKRLHTTTVIDSFVTAASVSTITTDTDIDSPNIDTRRH